MNNINSRRAALSLLAMVIDQGIMITSAQKENIESYRLCNAKEKRAAVRLSLDCFRNYQPSQMLLKSYLTKTPPQLFLRIIIIGVIELCVNQAAAHGVVNDSVKLTHELKRGSSFSGLVNAVLRKVSRDGIKVWNDIRPQSLPIWIGRPLKQQHGKIIQKKIEAVHSKIPPIDLTFKAGVEKNLEELPNGSLRVWKGAISKYSGYEEGQWWVQDAAASIPVKLLGNLRGKSVLDLCAAPGGKTMQLVDAGANVTALDISRNRMKVLKENLERVNFDANLVTTDIFSYKEDEEYDIVLLDAPCSATGTIRRHPDLPFLKGEEELAVLVILQKKMLCRAREFVKPGGHILYCTCSLLYDEGESQIEEFLLNNSDIYPVKIDYESVGLSKECESLNKSIRTRPDFWSEYGGMDGFFISHMRKKDVLANKN